MLQGKVVKIRKRAQRMEDPHPQRVSVVPGGSNQTPIRALKADNIEEIDMATNLKRGAVAIARFTFSDSAFKSEGDVRAWLEAGGYDIPGIVAVKGENFNGYTVASKEQPDNVQDIDLGNGVTAFVAVGVKEDELLAVEPRGHVVEVDGEAPAAATTGAQADKSETRDLVDANGNPDETAITAAEIAAAATTAPAAAGPADPGTPPKLITLDDKGAPGLVASKSAYDISSLADLLQSLAWANESVAYRVFAGDYSNEIAGSYKALITQLGALIQQVTAATVEAATKSETTEPAAEAAPEGAPAAEETTGTEPGEGGEPTSEGIATDVAPAAKTDDPMAALTALVGTMATAVQALTDQVAQTAAKADTAIERVSELSGTAPTRKSADVSDIEVSSQRQPAEKAETTRMRDRNALALLGA